MASLCHFHWFIRNPFLPWRNSEATFYHGSPTPTQWRATLQPVDRRVNVCSFLFSLEFDKRFKIKAHEFQIKAEKVKVRITHNRALVGEKETPYEFNTGNEFTYNFQSIDCFYPQKEPHVLDITVDISLPGIAEPNEPGNGHCTGDHDLECLSNDLKQLLDGPQYSNMRLMSSDSLSSIPAHSYILAARWNNFFKEHAFQEGDLGALETNISKDLLWDILTYMYSGQLAAGDWPNWRDAAYTTELFQVIDRYKLYHFYKVFVKNDLTQLRETSNHVLIESLLFPLDSFNGASNTQQVDRFIFQIRGRIGNGGGSWLSYSLQSKAPSRVIVQVILEVVRNLGRNEPEDPERVSSFHETDYTIVPGASVKSELVLFECPETFEGTKNRYFIRCFLNVTNETTLIQVREIDGFTLQNDLERFSVLSDHMHALKTQSIHQDMTICSRPLRPGIPDECQFQWPIHKGIFARRVPDYWEGLLGVPRENGVPDFATSTLSNEALHFVLDYLYTGKVSTIPIPYLGIIGDFAERTKFDSLKLLIDRIRSP